MKNLFIRRTKRQALLLLLSILVGGITAQVSGQSTIITGKVIDETLKEGLPGVNVLIKGSMNGTITDIDGKYSLEVPSTASILQFSFTGMKPEEVVVGNKSVINITLKEELTALEEVVVIGYGTVKRKDVTTAVSTVSTKDLQERPVVSAAQALQGKAAGVQVIQPSGQPGEGMVVRVRGTTSINASNDPLYVVDGVPMTDINFLAPNDIESMQILKDASSAAIYGSRAANGVVLITTKAGAKDDAKVSFSGYIGVSNIVKQMESLKMKDYYTLMSDLEYVLPSGLTDQTDWFKETFKTGVNQNYQLSVSNGNDKMRYFISGGFTKDRGIIDVSYYQRFNFRVNLENQIRPWLKFNTNLSYSDYGNNGVITGAGANRSGVVLSVINTPTYASIWDSANPGQYYNNFYGANLTHPVENMARSKDNRFKSNRLIGSVSGEITFVPELKLKSTFTVDRDNNHTFNFLDPKLTTYGRKEYGTAYDARSQSTVLVWDNILTYEKQFGKHGLNVMAGTSSTTSDWGQSYIGASHYQSGNIQTLNAANRIDPYGTGTTASQWAIFSLVGRIAYNYDSKYLLTVNFREDGSSKLAPNKRWGFFPSASAAWRISSEEFMQGIDWIDDLKLRGGWGQNGNQSGIGDYGYLQMYSIQRQPWWEAGKENSMITLSPANMRNKDLTWETTTQSNLGVDFTVLKGRLNFTADAYYKYTTNMLLNVPLPASASFNSLTRNEGEMENMGLEFALSSKNFTGDFKWDTDFNISFNRNKLKKLSIIKVFYYGSSSEKTNENVIRMTEGESLGRFYGFICDGVDPETGDLIYRDTDGVEGITGTDKTYIGDANPKFVYGMTNTLSYKGFNLNLFLQGSYGNDIYNASRMETEGMFSMNNQSVRVLDRWRTPGQVTYMPRASQGNENLRASTYFIEDGSYLRLKTVTLSYNFTGKWMKKAHISRIQPYFTAQNLFTITGYKGFDPEVNQWGGSATVMGMDWGTYPQTKSFIFGVNIDF